MKSAEVIGAGSGLRYLLVLDLLRVRSLARNPTPASVASLVLPAVVLLSALWLLGRQMPSSSTWSGASAGLTLSFLVSGSAAFLSHGVLFGGGDLRHLGRLGIGGGDIYRERGARLLLAGFLTGCALVLPSLFAGGPFLPPLLVSLTAVAVNVGVTALTYGWADRAITAPRLSRVLGAGMGFDPELARAAPLVYAPLPGFLAGAAAGMVAGREPGFAPFMAAMGMLAAVAAIELGARIFARAAARFLAAAGEMSFVPPPRKGGESFLVGRGLSRLLPTRAAAIWVRDAAVANRRFAWAARVTWPVVGVSMIALARWGDLAAARMWVLTVVGLALIVQGAAVVGLGRLERAGRGWIDRSLGVGALDRFLGRWSWAWGLSLWMLLPVGLAWGWWAGGTGLWRWPLAGAVAALVSTSASLLTAAR